MQPASKKELLRAARQRVQPGQSEKAPGPSGDRVKITTKGPSAPRLPTGKQLAERPREEPEEPPHSKRHKSSSKEERRRERGKGKAPAGPAPTSEPIDVDDAIGIPTLRDLFRQYTDTIDLPGSLGPSAAEVEENLLLGHAKISCAIRHYMIVVPKLRQKEKEAEKLEAEVARLNAMTARLEAEKTGLEEDLGARNCELKTERNLCEERRQRLGELQKHYEEQHRQLEEQRQQLEEQLQRIQAAEDSVASERTKAVADYLGSAEFKEIQTVQTAEMLQEILDSTQRRLAKRCPGLDTSFLYADSDGETEVTGAAPEAAPEAGPEAGTAEARLEEGEVSRPIDMPPTPPTPPTPYSEIP